MAVVWHLSMVRLNDSCVCKGVILSNSQSPINPDNSWLRHAKYIIQSYRKQALSNSTITVYLNGESIASKTNMSGTFEVIVNNETGITDEVDILYKGEIVPILQSYPTYFQNHSTDLVVISDIDETILRSFTSNAYKRMKTTLFKSINKREAIPFTKSLYSYLSQKGARFFYVSKSESNLFEVISGFIIKNKLPEGALILSPYLNLRALLKNKKEKDFKSMEIENVIRNLPNKKFVLIGDDSQADPIIYSRIVNKYSAQIKVVFLLQTKKKISKSQQENWNTLKDAGVECYYYKQSQSFADLHLHFS